MDSFKIKKANIEDAVSLAMLFDQYRVFYRKESDLEGAETFLLERLAREESIIFFCEADNKIIGFTQLYPLFSSTVMQRLWLLNDLFVLPEFRGKGISKALLEACKSHAVETGACGLMLETEKNNRIANRLYLSTQWELDEDHNYYSLSTK